jgi:hypothetical protein
VLLLWSAVSLGASVLAVGAAGSTSGLLGELAWLGLAASLFVMVCATEARD